MSNIIGKKGKTKKNNNNLFYSTKYQRKLENLIHI